MNKPVKKELAYALLFIMVASCVALTSCNDDDNDELESMSIVGKWICYTDAYGDPWDEPLVYQFDSDGTGYEWFMDEPFSNREEFTYTVTETRLRIKTKYDSYILRYELSNKGKSLILYGWDDDDMEELHLVRQ